jgi:hypothetical protein
MRMNDVLKVLFALAIKISTDKHNGMAMPNKQQWGLETAGRL